MSGTENPPGLDLERLRRHLDAERPGLVTGALDGALIEGGRSNLTYAVTDGALPLGRAPPAARPRPGHGARHGAASTG